MNDEEVRQKIARFLAGEATEEEAHELFTVGYQEALAYFYSDGSEACSGCTACGENPEDGIDLNMLLKPAGCDSNGNG